MSLVDAGPFLSASKYVDFDDPVVAAKAAALAHSASSRTEIARRCFEFVRDEIKHSVDFMLGPITCKASDVLRHGTGFCYAKSHLLAALLRANGLPAGLCYQRLSIGEQGAPYCLHGLNAVYLDGYGWYRIDARGNKPGINAAFTPPVEALAFAVRPPTEHDFPQILPNPLPCVVETLEAHTTVEEMLRHLPDVAA